MRVLVATASKYGSTQEIGEAIVRALRERDIDAEAIRVEDVTTLEGVDALVLGSGVYAGHWMKTARSFVKHHAHQFSEVPVWLFSSGPIGESPHPADDGIVIEGIRKATG